MSESQIYEQFVSICLIDLFIYVFVYLIIECVCRWFLSLNFTNRRSISSSGVKVLTVL